VEKRPSPSLKILWEQAVAPLKAKLDAEEYETWIEPLKPVSAGGGVVELAVPNRMFASWVESNFLDDLAAAWVGAAGATATFRFTWGPTQLQGELFPTVLAPDDADQAASADARGSQTDRRKPRPRELSARPGSLIGRYDFESFVVGQSNQFARAAAIAVVGQP